MLQKQNRKWADWGWGHWGWNEVKKMRWIGDGSCDEGDEDSETSECDSCRLVGLNESDLSNAPDINQTGTCGQSEGWSDSKGNKATTGQLVASCWMLSTALSIERGMWGWCRLSVGVDRWRDQTRMLQFIPRIVAIDAATWRPVQSLKYAQNGATKRKGKSVCD